MYIATMNKTLATHIQKLEAYLKVNYPECVLIPNRSNVNESDVNGKSPLWAHKNMSHESLWDKWAKEGRSNCAKGFVMVLRKGLIVIDIDDALMAMSFEAQFPAMKATSIQTTSKGKHYFFNRTDACDKHKIFDGSRCLVNDNNPTEKLPIDIKTVCANGTGGVISMYPSKNKVWSRCIYDYPPIDLPQDLFEYIVKFHEKKHKKAKVANVLTPASQSVDIDEVRSLSRMLRPTRAEDYREWMNVGWCLHNIDATLLDEWIQFSSQSSKFEEGVCEDMWDTMRNEGLGLGSLHMWAKEDNPMEYKALINKRVDDDIWNCNGSHNAVAAIAYKVLKGKFVCALPEGKLWYRFEKSLWREDKCGICIRHELSTTLRDHFLYTMNKKISVQSVYQMESASQSTTNSTKDNESKIMHISYKLQDAGFKDSVIKEMREYFYDQQFLKKLDSKPQLIAFTNGVWDLDAACFRESVPEDYVSLSVGYDYTTQVKECDRVTVRQYFEKVHPHPPQRNYVIRMFARQLYGDWCMALFHMHAGLQGSAANGKTVCFSILDCVLGDYVHRFPVQVLTAKVRDDANKPAPEYQYWRGRRIIYCTEPKEDDVLHSGIMKQLTGGESVAYRLLFSSDSHEFIPQFKMHIMCNDTPKVDGADSGVKRRIRKIDYISQFVPSAQVDESQHRYLADASLCSRVTQDDGLKMAFFEYIVSHFDKNYEFDMPECIATNSKEYLDENNIVLEFATQFIRQDEGAFFTLSEVKERYRRETGDAAKLGSLKSNLEKHLKIKCFPQKKVNNKNYKNVFYGFKLLFGPEVTDDIDS